MRDTGIKDRNGDMIKEGNKVRFGDGEPDLVVVWVGEGDYMDWAADKPDGEPGAWLDSSCVIIK